MITLLLAFTLNTYEPIFEPVTLPDGTIIKCIKTPTGTYCY